MPVNNESFFQRQKRTAQRKPPQGAPGTPFSPQPAANPRPTAQMRGQAYGSGAISGPVGQPQRVGGGQPPMQQDTLAKSAVMPNNGQPMEQPMAPGGGVKMTLGPESFSRPTNTGVMRPVSMPQQSAAMVDPSVPQASGDAVSRPGVLPADGSVSAPGGSQDFDESSGTYRSTGTNNRFHTPKSNGTNPIARDTLHKEWVPNYLNQKLGRQATEAEWAWINQKANELGIGASATPQQWNALVDAMDQQIPGARQQPGTPAPPPPAQPPGVPGQPKGVVIDPGTGYQPGELPSWQSGTRIGDGFRAGTMPGLVPGADLAPRTDFADFNDPTNKAIDERSAALMERVLMNPESLSPELVSALKARGKESALGMAGQLRDSAAGDLASRGFSAGGGTAAAANAQVDNQLIDDIIRSNRDIDIAAASTNSADRLNALGASEAFQSGRVGRAGDIFRNVLTGQTTQADDDFRRTGFEDDQSRFENTFGLERFKTGEAGKQAESDDEFRRFGVNDDIRRSDNDFGLKRYQVGEEGRRAADDSNFRNNEFRYGQVRDDRNMTLQEFLGREGVDLDKRRLGEDTRRFDKTHGLDIAKLIESVRQFNVGTAEEGRQHNNQIGLGYNQLTAQQQSQLMNWLMGQFGG